MTNDETTTKYDVRKVTPEAMKCILASCPAVYEVVERTPKKLDCVVGSCARIYEESQGRRYVIIGRVEKPEEFGLEKKVGEGEALISIPKGLIDEMRR